MAIQTYLNGQRLVSAATNYADRSSPLTVTCWINSTVWGTGVTASMVGVYLSGTTGIQIGTRGTTNCVDVWTWGGDVGISTSGLFTPTNNVWIHIAYGYDGSSHYIYINGDLVNTRTAVVVPGILNQVYINGYPTGITNETSDTQVDDVAYYNRLLTANEVKTIASSRGYRDGILNGLFARYCFNESSPGTEITSIIDYSGNRANPLTLEGAGTAPIYIAGTTGIDTRPVLG